LELHSVQEVTLEEAIALLKKKDETIHESNLERS
jgi:hypothetical protein